MKLQSVLQKLALFLGTGAMFVAVSEFWFYQMVDEAGSITVVLFYSVFAYAFIVSAIYFRLHTFAGIFVAAALFGFLIESVLVPVLFSGMPFTIVWTSLAWHALISVMVFWYGYRHLLSRLNPVIKVGYLSLMGAALGLWNSYMWNVVEDGSEVITYAWIEPGIFFTQFITGYTLFVGGHLLYTYGVRSPLSISRFELGILFWLITAVFVVGYGFSMFPFSLVLPVLVYICYLAFRKQFDETSVSSIFISPLAKIPWQSHIYSVCIPIAAGAVYFLAYTYKFEAEVNVWLILTAGPLSVYWFIKSLVQCLKKRG